MPRPTNLRRRSWVKTRARGAKWFLLIASLRHTTLIVIIFTDYASNKMQYVYYTILCITLCITNGDFRAFCVTQQTSVTHGRKRKTSNNLLIITRLSRAENGTRTRDLNLGKVALYQLSYFRNYRFRTGGTTASAPRLRASKPAFRDCKYKPKNLFCKIFRRILSQNYSCAARNAKKRNAGADAIAQACPAPTPRSERQQK